MSDPKPITIQALKTLNLDHPSLIPSDHWSDTQNMVVAADGLWENRKGIKTFDNAVGSGEAVHSLHFWKPSAGSSRLLTVGSGTALYSYAEVAAYNDGSFTSRQTGFTDGQRFEFAQYDDTLIATNGAEAMYTTTNNTAWTIRNGANTRIAKYIIFANDVGYCADVASNRTKVYYGSAVPANPYEFANAVEIDADNGQIITGLTNLGPIIVAGKTRSAYSVDIATPTRQQLDFGEGVTSHRGFVRALNNIYLTGKEGVSTLSQRDGTTGSLAATPISAPIQNLWSALVNKGNIPGIYNPDTKEILWTVETAERIFTLVYNVRFDAWSYFTGVNAADWTIYEDSSGAEHLLYGDSNVDSVRELYHPDRDDDGAPINSVLATGSLSFGTNKYKVLDSIEISGYGSSLMELTVEVFFDEETVASVTKTITADNFAATGASSGSGALADQALAESGLAGSVTSASDLEVFYWVKEIPLERTFRTIRVKLSNAQAGVRWRFKAIEANGLKLAPPNYKPSYLFN